MPGDTDDNDASGSPHGNERGNQDIANVEEIMAKTVSPMAGTLSLLMQQVAALVADRNYDVTNEAAVSGARKAAEETRMTVDGWRGMRIGEANRLYKDNLTAVTVTKAGDSKFASARAC
jgi:hypothetical protein